MTVKPALNQNTGGPLDAENKSARTIMFVDDNAHYLNSLRRCLPLRRAGWNLSYARSWAEAGQLQGKPGPRAGGGYTPHN